MGVEGQKSFLTKLSGTVPASLLIKFAGKRDVFPFYHAINSFPPAHLRQLYKVKSKDEFIKDLDFFLRYFEPGDIREIEINNKKKKPCFYLTFDDGLAEVYHIISPILKAKGVPAAFFINSGFIDNKKLFYRYKVSLILDELLSKRKSSRLESEIYAICGKKKEQFQNVTDLLLSLRYHQEREIDYIAKIAGVNFEKYLENEKPYLSSAQIWELINEDFVIGAHSIDHPHYSRITIKEQIRQTKESLDFINKKFGIKNNYFAFPFSDVGVSDHFFKIIQQKKIAEYTFGTSGMKSDTTLKNIQRIPMEQSALSGKQNLKSEYLQTMVKKGLGRNEILRK